MKSLITILFLFISGVSLAGKHQHTEGSRMGSHGMALLTDGEHVYASHMPLYFAPHDVQLVYKVSLFHAPGNSAKNKAIKAALFNKLVTLLPENFDLNTLINGEALLVKSKIYDGHFERGGNVWFEDVYVQFESQIYKRMLTKEQSTLSIDKTTSDKATYTLVELPTKKVSQKNRMAIRQIASAPSVDHILILSGKKMSSNSESDECQLDAKEENLIFGDLPAFSMQQTFIEKSFESCSKLIGRYWETADFVAR